MKEKNIKFNLVTKSIEEEFDFEYNKVKSLRNTTINLAIYFENNREFMSAFKNEFSLTSTKPDVAKYWIGLYTKKKVDEVFLIQKGIIKNNNNTLTETKLLEKRNEFFELVSKNKAPKECYTHKIEETNIYKQFRAIEEILNRFKEMKGFDTSVDSLVKQAEEFGKALISEIQNINYEPIRDRIIEVIIKDKENFNSYLNGYNNRNFNSKEFDDNYAKAKMYLDNYLKIYLDTQRQTIKENNQSKTIEKKTTMKETYLFDIGLKLALGELDNYLLFTESDIFKGAEKKYTEISRKTNLDYQHLKCTLTNSTDQSNKSKNLRNNPEIIKKVLTHLKSIGKEPKNWFLKEFKI